MRSRAAASVILGVLALGGCKEDPSWAVRWRIAPRPGMEFEPTPYDDEDVLLDSVACSRVGVSVIEFATTRKLDSGLRPPDTANESLLVDDRVKPCWSDALEDPDRTLGGPALEPGDYELVSLALRSNGRPWCVPGLSADCNFDNFADDAQGACIIGPAKPGKCESDVWIIPPDPKFDGECVPRCGPGEVWSFVDGCYDKCVPEVSCDFCSDLRFAPSCWGEAEACHPSYLSCECNRFTVVDDETTVFDDIVIDAPPECEDGIDGDEDGLVDALDPGCQNGDSEAIDIFSTQLVFDFSLLSHNEAATCGGVKASRFEISLDDVVVATPACDVGTLGVNIVVQPGPHEVSVRAVAFDGTPVTRAKAVPLEARTGGVLDPQRVAFDFSDADFIDPIRSAAQFAIGFTAAEGLPTRFCTGAPGRLDIEEVRVGILDAGGEPVEPAVLVEHGEAPLPGMRLDGELLPCTQQLVITEELRWGTYQVQVKAFSAEGDLCFSNVGEPALLAPGTGITVVTPRVLPVAASCRDCDTAADCTGLYRCEEGICVP